MPARERCCARVLRMSMSWYLLGLWRLPKAPYKLGTTSDGQMPPVEIYTTRYCPYCVSAKALLTRKGIPFKEIDVSGNWELRQKMVERARRMTVPQIFIGSVHVGGS